MGKAKKIIVLALSILALICISALIFVNLKNYVYLLEGYKYYYGDAKLQLSDTRILNGYVYPMIEFMFTAILLGLTALSIIFANFLYFKKQISISIAFSKQEIAEKVGKMRANRKQAKKDKLKNKLEEMEKDTK
jgi:hypothetical protein